MGAGGVNSAKVKGDGDVIRIFVALFPYDPSTMSPNPDAAEEELPFSEGQIIKVRPSLPRHLCINTDYHAHFPFTVTSTSSN